MRSVKFADETDQTLAGKYVVIVQGDDAHIVRIDGITRVDDDRLRLRYEYVSPPLQGKLKHAFIHSDQTGMIWDQLGPEIEQYCQEMRDRVSGG
jgi:hypothetical protein